MNEKTSVSANDCDLELETYCMTVPHGICVKHVVTGDDKGRGFETRSEKQSVSMNVTESTRGTWMSDEDCDSSSAVPESPQVISQLALSGILAKEGEGLVVSMVTELGVGPEEVAG